MMRRNLLRFALACGVGGLLFSMTAAEGATFALRAVNIKRGVQNINVAPAPGSGAGQELSLTSQQITAMPGDEITAEIRIFNFAEMNFPETRGAKTFQATLANRAGGTSSGNPAGLILPKGWDAPITESTIFCSSDLDCAFRPGLHCEGETPTTQGQCIGAAHSPQTYFTIDLGRPDFIHAGRATFPEPFTSTQSLDFYTVVSNVSAPDPVDGPFNNPTNDYYGATIVYTVQPFACGTYTLGFSIAGGSQTLVDHDSFPQNQVVMTLPLVVNMTPCPPLIESETPPNCDIDARRPWTETEPVTSPIPAAAHQGMRNVEFCYDRDPATVVGGSFTIRRVPFNAPAQPTAVSSVDQLAGDCLRANFNGALAPRAYTCVKQDGNTPAGIKSGIEKCWGFLPGDVNANGVTNALDIEDGMPFQTIAEDLIEWIRIGAIHDLLRCDMDRSGSCNGLDLLTAINMLNGSGSIGPGSTTFNGTGVWLNQTFLSNVACPSPE